MRPENPFGNDGSGIGSTARMRRNTKDLQLAQIITWNDKVPMEFTIRNQTVTFLSCAFGTIVRPRRHRMRQAEENIAAVAAHDFGQRLAVKLVQQSLGTRPVRSNDER